LQWCMFFLTQSHLRVFEIFFHQKHLVLKDQWHEADLQQVEMAEIIDKGYLEM